MQPISNTQFASLTRRFAACLYELFLLMAIWLVCAFGFVMIFGNADSALKRTSLQILLWLASGVYFVWCWHKNGQTLAAQTWKIKLVNAQNMPITIKQAWQRYALASASLLALGLGFLWALVDKEEFFLHDRLMKTRLIQCA